ncbi:hypothetical protein [Bacillus phage SPbetaL6]|nr:hypothetical protein [Bacillus phage SPbetaL4]WIT27862.1 hypothetical protein [Bacillus phage SPbetaL6]WIT28046.1 hypothetical protein [Bacillus phage SPbetaL7]
MKKSMKKKTLLRNVKILATYSDCFRVKQKTEEEIQKLFKRVPFRTTCLFLSKMSTEKINEKQIKLSFLNHIKQNPNQKAALKSFEKTLMEYTVFSPQTILQFWKYLISYGDPEYNEEIPNITFSSMMVFLSMIINDTFGSTSKSELTSEVFSNGIFSYNHHFGVALARTNYIYTTLASNKENFNEKDYLDINKDFYEKYGYTINEYISVWFGFITAFLDPFQKDNWPQKLMYFNKTKLYPIAQEILGEEGQTINEAKVFSTDTLNKPWDFSSFISKPLLLLNNQEFLPLSLYLIKKEFFYRLFYKVREIYPRDDERFLSFFGKPFEIYAQNLLEESLCPNLNYKFVKSFKYGVNGNKDSPDIMLRLGNRLIVIEVKSLRLSFRTVFESTNKFVEKDINRLIINPLKQASSRVKEMFDFGLEYVDGVDELDFIILGNGNIPKIKGHKDSIKREIEPHLSKLPVTVKSYNYLSIEEFEYFCSLTEKKKPVFKVLERYFNETELLENFKNFLNHNSYRLIKPAKLDKLYRETADTVKKNLFESE